jgi:hypothetical protein
MKPGDILPADLFSPEDLERIVGNKLPGWKRACTESDADAIVLHELAFGMSGSELLLFSCALKYAALKGKNVHVVCGRADGAKAIEGALPEARFAGQYRDTPADVTPLRPRRRHASR